MKNLGGQDTQAETQEEGRQCEGLIRESVPLSPAGHRTPSRISGVLACSLKVSGAKRNVFCPDSADFPSKSPTKLPYEEYHWLILHVLKS